MKDELDKLAEYTLATMKAEIAKDNIVVVVLHQDGSIKRARTPDGFAQIMAHVELKEVFFAGLRALVKKLDAKGIAVGTDTYRGLPTAKATALSNEEYEKLTDTLGMKELEAGGYVTIEEAFSVIVQTRETFLSLSAAYRHTKLGTEWDAPITARCPIEQFVGRGKVF